MILVIDQKNTRIRYRAGSVIIEQDGNTPKRVPVKQIEQMIVHGNPSIDAAVLRALAGTAAPAVFLPSRGLPETAMLGSGLATQLNLRRMQHQCANHSTSALVMAHWFIHKKLISYTLSVHHLENYHPRAKNQLQTFQTQTAQTIQQLTTSTGQTLETLLGLEGQLARAWFNLLANTLPKKWKFTGRNRQPPRDPVNALFSLGYTLLLSETRQVLLSQGFDLALGFLHQPYPAREALALDFIEPFRSGVDSFVLKLVTSGWIDQNSFYYREKEGCRLAKSARPVFYEQWANWLEHWPRFNPTEHQKNDIWPTTPLREQVAGLAADARTQLSELTDQNNG